MKINTNLKTWESFDEFIKHANEHCNWLVLRNFEFLPNDFFGNDKDVDVLCLDIEQFTHTMGLVRRSDGISAYKGSIASQSVDFDIRFLGDGYYDKRWQWDMLSTKVFTKERVPRMNDENYFYSLLWHAKLQKTAIKTAYIGRLYNLAAQLSLRDYKEDSIFDDIYIAAVLNHFLITKKYYFERPCDYSIPLNPAVYNLLDRKVTLAAYRLNWKQKMIRVILAWIPTTFKNWIKILIRYEAK